jgi:sugar phosphate isomerase/epimerase
MSALLGLALLACSTTRDKTVGTGRSFHGPVGLQLWSLRDHFAKEVPGTLQLVKGMGFRYVELAGTYGMAPGEFKAKLHEFGLVPVAAHFGFDRFKTDPEGVAVEAKALGLKYAGVAWVPHEGAFDEKKCLETAAVFNKAGEVLARHGLRFFYHVHGYEFVPTANGKTLFDRLMEETRPEYVGYEMDILWTYFPGQDPVSLLKRYGKRWELIHLKDLKKGVETGSLSGGTDTKNDVILGTGQIPLPGILRAAQQVGVKYYFIEDESPWAAEQIPQSLRYLSSLSW